MRTREGGTTGRVCRQPDPPPCDPVFLPVHMLRSRTPNPRRHTCMWEPLSAAVSSRKSFMTWAERGPDGLHPVPAGMISAVTLIMKVAGARERWILIYAQQLSPPN